MTIKIPKEVIELYPLSNAFNIELIGKKPKRIKLSLTDEYIGLNISIDDFDTVDFNIDLKTSEQKTLSYKNYEVLCNKDFHEVAPTKFKEIYQEMVKKKL